MFSIHSSIPGEFRMQGIFPFQIQDPLNGSGKGIICGLCGSLGKMALDFDCNTEDSKLFKANARLN